MTIDEYNELKARYNTLGVTLKFDEFDYFDSNYKESVTLTKWKSKDKLCKVPEFIFRIYSDCFKGLDYLEEIDLSESNIYFLPDRLFENLKVKRVKLNNLINIIPKYCFYNTEIEEIIIPKSVETIDAGAFKYCSNLKRVIFEDDSQLKLIKGEAFKSSGLLSITLPDSVERLHYSIFYGCKDLKEVYLGKNLRIVNSNVFSYCDNLEKIIFDIESPVKKIASYCCVNSYNLKEVVFSNNTDSFLEYCFMGCKSLEKVVLNEENLKVINFTAFIDTPFYLKFKSPTN